ncbi:hypothetical protein EMIHUDRAFT_204808 [Emiliania huxleyi CCMP1516]|uniref:EXS domain-containing protein n=2 Tax=Emiliania huxleyi TaxID=2903 RepID=A0A0D3JWE0_EMIH1|nr:hypothetical protein EMIHUDRAFT_204808 [Emiliania huxleyi CCMP1516]EOD27825.1 hypothetical protein EMIHUDRAFT_204808 [Emiliania huxleyi CCMP1516]|eukprot:XP_005780254.1 hypothetical protein EMIHUDRAFT_204808 [Emiliania huxleyi CCMP1516]
MIDFTTRAETTEAERSCVADENAWTHPPSIICPPGADSSGSSSSSSETPTPARPSSPAAPIMRTIASVGSMLESLQSSKATVAPVASLKLYDGLGSDQTASVEAIAALYYPLFRAMLLLSYFGILFGVLLFAWKRCGIDYTAILGVDGGRTNVHAVVRASTSLMGLNFSAFVLYWLALLCVQPFDHMAEWSDAAQRADCARCVGRVLLAGLVPTTFASSFVADILTSMPKLFIDLLQAVVQRQEYAAGSNTQDHHAGEH